MIKRLHIDHIHIGEGNICHYGPHQHWFARRTHGINGCGPTTAAQIMQYMASAFEELCAPLYPYPLPPCKDDFAAHMQQVRKFVRPGLMGLTDPKYFVRTTLAYAKSCGVDLRAQKISPSLSAGIAFGYMRKAIDEGYMPALLILRNPFSEINDFTWHWMAVTGYDDEKGEVFVSTYTKEHALPFERVWYQAGSYRAAGVYFFPKHHDPSPLKFLRKTVD